MSNELPIHPVAEAPERPHAERSASQLKSLAVCPGYLPKKNRKRQHWVTQQGIRGHKALETDDDSVLQSDYEQALVQLVRDYEGSLPAPVAILKEFKINTIEGRWGYVDTLRFVSEQTFLPGLAAEDIARQCETVDVIDYKFTKAKEVEDAEINLQQKDYAAGLFDDFPKLKTIRVHIPMPRFGTVSIATFTRDMLPQLKLDVLAVLRTAKRTDKARVPAKLFNPTYDVCRFCARASCPKMYELFRKVAVNYATEPLPELPENIHSSQCNDPKALGAMKQIAAVAKNWAESVDHNAFEKAIDDHIVAEGYVIDYLDGKRKVTNVFALFEIAKKHGLDIADVLEAANVSLKKLEDRVMENAPRGDKKSAKAAFLDDLRARDAIERREDTPYLRKV